MSDTLYAYVPHVGAKRRAIAVYTAEGNIAHSFEPEGRYWVTTLHQDGLFVAPADEDPRPRRVRSLVESGNLHEVTEDLCRSRLCGNAHVWTSDAPCRVMVTFVEELKVASWGSAFVANEWAPEGSGYAVARSAFTREKAAEKYAQFRIHGRGLLPVRRETAVFPSLEAALSAAGVWSSGLKMGAVAARSESLAIARERDRADEEKARVKREREAAALAEREAVAAAAAVEREKQLLAANPMTLSLEDFATRMRRKRAERSTS